MYFRHSNNKLSSIVARSRQWVPRARRLAKQATKPSRGTWPRDARAPAPPPTAQTEASSAWPVRLRPSKQPQLLRRLVAIALLVVHLNGLPQCRRPTKPISSAEVPTLRCESNKSVPSGCTGPKVHSTHVSLTARQLPHRVEPIVAPCDDAVDLRPRLTQPEDEVGPPGNLVTRG